MGDKDLGHGLDDFGGRDTSLFQSTLSSRASSRTRVQALALSALAIIEGMGAMVWLINALSQPILEERLYFVWGAVLGLVSAALGIYGASARSRTALILFFINQLWGLALVSTRLFSELRELREEAEYCQSAPSGPASDDLDQDVDCSTIRGRLSHKVTSGFGGMLSMWIAAFVGYRLSELIQDRETASEDARIAELVLRVKAEVQESATEFEEFVCKRLDDLEEAVQAAAGLGAPLYARGAQ